MEFVVELVGAVLRAMFEALLSAVFGRIARFIAFIYNGIYQIVRWNLDSDFLAIPVTIQLMLALAAASFFGLVKAIQWMIT